jgi:chitin disaccharide deacetylase
MLIVNADDWGLRPEVTDAIAECWAAGAVTCASAMVGMADSERAFELAAALELPLGLHLNLTTPFTAAVDPEAARRQAGAVAYFAGPARRRLLLDPRARGRLDACVADQLDAFAAGRGAEAGHADGHQHVQVCPTVLTGGSLGRVRSLRCAHAFVAGAPSPAKDAYRRVVNFAVRRRFRSASFVSLRDLHPALGGVGLERLREWSRGEDLEVMVHPAWDDEREVLLSPGWKQLMAELPTGSHDDLT